MQASVAYLVVTLLGTTVVFAQGRFNSDISFSGIVYEQAPNGRGGAASNERDLIRADDFELSQPALIRSVTWWGADFQPVPGVDQFTVQVLTEAAGKPSTPLPQVALEGVQRTISGGTVFVSYPEYEYRGVLQNPVALEAGVRYWLRLSNPLGFWVWESSGVLPGGSIAMQSPGGDWQITTDAYDLAFALSTDVPEPASGLLMGLAVCVLWSQRLLTRRTQALSRRSQPTGDTLVCRHMRACATRT